jgi:23S rRNA pseudouridine1911/1915/1917 synthase
MTRSESSVGDQHRGLASKKITKRLDSMTAFTKKKQNEESRWNILSSCMFLWPRLLVFFLHMIPILYEESHFLLVNKPAGLLTQAVPGVDSLQTTLVEQLKIRDQHAGKPFVGMPHRLDRATSGVLLIARNQRALSRFGSQFQNRLVQKFYVAWVEGRWDFPKAPWKDYIRKIDGQALAEIVPEGTEGGRLAEMEVRSIASDEGHHLLLVRLMTGRMHQIRLQLASRGLPIIGDRQYGSRYQFVPEKSNEFRLGIDKESTEVCREAPHGLHALRLEFRHPKTAIFMAESAPFPDYWESASQPLRSAMKAIHWLSCQNHQQPWCLDSLQLPQP